MFYSNSSFSDCTHSPVAKLAKGAIALACASCAVIGSGIAARAANLNFSYADGTTLQQMLGFELAGQIISDHLGDDVDINIYVEMTSALPTNVVGGALPGIKADYSYKRYRKALERDRTSGDDYTAYSNLDDGNEFGARISTENWRNVFLEENDTLNITTATAKAAGVFSGDPNGLDGFIKMSDLSRYNVGWNYDYLGNSVAYNQLDFLGVALHEVIHILGFNSGVDDPGWLNANQLWNLGYHSNDLDEYLDSRLDSATALDLFRCNNSPYWSGVDLSVGGNPFFSIDGCRTNLANFSSGEDTSAGGDGYQASHWQRRSNPVGILAPTITTGTKRTASNLDWQALDVIGWDRKPGGTSLSTLLDRAKLNLAQQLSSSGQAWWIDYYINNGYNTTAASWITNDRTKDVNQMIRKSKIYGNWWGGGGGWWQEAGLWQTGGLSQFEIAQESESVPEPSSTAGLLGLGLLSAGVLLKQSRKVKK